MAQHSSEGNSGAVASARVTLAALVAMMTSSIALPAAEAPTATIGVRAAEARQSLEASKLGESASGQVGDADSPVVARAQWINWGNWGNWGNWANWNKPWFNFNNWLNY